MQINTNSSFRSFQPKASASPAATPQGPADTLERSAPDAGIYKPQQPPAQQPPAEQPPAEQQPPAQQPPAQQEPPLAKWTILQYSAADNNLYKYLYDDVALMEKVGSDAGTHVVVQIDHANHAPNSGAQRIYLERDTEAPPVQGANRQMSVFKAVGTPGGHGPNGTIDSPVTQELGQIDMADPKVLADFIKWGVKNYPAEHFCLIISDHGDAWKGACEDDTHNGWMDLPEIKQALAEAQAETGKKLDIVGFDACLMANAEVGYELKDHAHYLVGSEQTEGADGWPYQAILTPDTLSVIKAQNTAGAIDLEPADLAMQVVNKAADNQGVLPTMSAFDLSQMQGVADAVKGLKDAIVATETPSATLKQLRRDTQSFHGYRDLAHFAEQVAANESITDEKLKTAAQDVVNSVKSAVIAEQHATKFPGARGMTIEMSRTSSSGYFATAFQKETEWNSAVNKIDRSEAFPGGDVPVNPITGLPAAGGGGVTAGPAPVNPITGLPAAGRA